MGGRGNIVTQASGKQLTPPGSLKDLHWSDVFPTVYNSTLPSIWKERSRGFELLPLGACRLTNLESSYPFFPVGSQYHCGNMAAIEPSGLHPGERDSSCPQEGIPRPSGSLELVSGAMGTNPVFI